MNNANLHHILYVEDDVDLRNYFYELAKPFNIVLEFATTIHEAKKKITHAHFDAYIVDLQLPDGESFELISLIRKKIDRQVPIAVVTGIYRDSESFKKLKEFDVQYVFEKPLQPDQVRNLFNTLCHTSEKPDRTKTLADLRMRYVKSIGDKLTFLETLIKDVQSHSNIETLGALKEAVHKISGNAGSYGFPNVSVLCKTLELMISKKIEELPTLPDQAWLLSLDDFLREVKNNFQIPFQESSQEEDLKAFVSERLAVYIVDEDQRFLHLIDREKEHFSLDVKTESNAQKALQKLSTPGFNPCFIFLNYLFNIPSKMSGYELIEAAQKKKDALPTVFGLFVNDGDIDPMKVRLEAVQKGVEYVLQKPFPVENFLRMIKDALEVEVHYNFKAVVVDDDPDICRFVTVVLEQVGIKVYILPDGTQLYQTLEKEKPDVLLLDILLPGYDGLQLLHALRTDARYRNLSVVVITARQDAEMIKSAYAADVDDILYKPLNPAILKTRISKLAKKHALAEYPLQTEKVTGLSKINSLYSHIREHLALPSLLSSDEHLALLKIDHFPKIEQEYGKAETDALLISVSNLLLRFLWRNSRCAYLGNGKFGLLSDVAEVETMQKLLRDCLEEGVHELNHPSKKGPKISFCCGIISIPKGSKNIKYLFECAEKALHLAEKHADNLPVKIEIYAAEGNQAQEMKEIVLIDPDENLLNILTNALVARGFSVKPFKSGEQALENLCNRKQMDLPSLIILERHLPDMDGIEVLKELKRRYPVKIPLFFLTDLSSDKDIFDGLGEGALQYIQKPFNLSILIKQILSNIYK